ncbi:hypothetical protein AGMMS49983_11570 [Clostridia bacterium]|nr:hypothetical protein AGMMS49983_11570 [Clostridia bacterium]
MTLTNEPNEPNETNETEGVTEDDAAKVLATEDIDENAAEDVTVEDIAEEVTEDVTEAETEIVTVTEAAPETAANVPAAEPADAPAYVYTPAYAPRPTPAAAKNRNLAIVIVVIVIALAVVVILLLSKGFGGAEDPGSGSEVIAVDENVVAMVGNSQITKDMVDHMSALMVFNDYGISLEQVPAEQLDILKNQILISFLVQVELIKEHLKETGTSALSEEQLATVASDVEAYYASIENSEETLNSMGVTRADVEYFFDSYEYMALYQEEVIAANPVTDAEIQQFYDESQAYFEVPAQISASHILIMDADHTPEKRAELEAILARAQAGEDFAELAKEYSEDPGSAERGGDVGYFGESNNFVPEFSAAALTLENVGDISDIVETDYGYHIIKLTDRQEATTQSLSEVRESITAYLENQHTSEAAAALKAEIPVVYYVQVDPATGEPPISLPPQTAPATPAEGDLPETVPLPEE